jgi:hypothetical protein
VATRNIGGSAMLTDNSCRALEGQPIRDVLPVMPRELAAHLDSEHLRSAQRPGVPSVVR